MIHMRKHEGLNQGIGIGGIEETVFSVLQEEIIKQQMSLGSDQGQECRNSGKDRSLLRAFTYFLLLGKPLPLYMLKIAHSFEFCLSSSSSLKQTYRYTPYFAMYVVILFPSSNE